MCVDDSAEIMVPLVLPTISELRFVQQLAFPETAAIRASSLRKAVNSGTEIHVIVHDGALESYL